MDVFSAASAAWWSGTQCALATVISVDGSAPRHTGARMLVRVDGSIVGTIGGGQVEHRAIAQALDAIRTGTARRMVVHTTRDLGMCCGGEVEVFIEPLEVRQPLFLFGAGHVAQAVAPMLCALDLAVTIVDDRDELATEERFVGCRVLAVDPRAFAAGLRTDARTLLLIATHDHALDQDLVQTLLPRDYAWLGMMGSRSKVAKFCLRLKAAGVDPALFRRLSAPVGLDLGSETPAEIAVSIAAEVVRIRRGCRRAPVPLASIPIAARGADGIAVPPALAEPTETVKTVPTPTSG